MAESMTTDEATQTCSAATLRALSEASGSVHCNEARVWAACACISRQLVSSPMAMSAVSKCCARPAQLGEGEGEGEDEVEGEGEGKGEE